MRDATHCRAFLFVAAVASGHAQAFQATTRVSVDSAGVEAFGRSVEASLSDDGRLVVFNSDAANLVAGDGNTSNDVFLRDTTTGATERVSVDSAGIEGNADSYIGSGRAVSADGSLIVFTSKSSNLDPNDTNGFNDIFVRDRWAATTMLVSVDSSGAIANGRCWWSEISADGRFVCFASEATNLVANDGNQQHDVFLRDLWTSTTERISVDSANAEGNAGSWRGSVSGDGRYVAFESSATNFVAGDTNGRGDIFLRDRQSGTTTRISVDSNGAQSNNESFHVTISSDGAFIAFESVASNLVAGDGNQRSDIFVRDVARGTTCRVSVSSSGGEGDSDSYEPAISANGGRIAFTSHATNLVAGDTNVKSDVFVHDLVSGETTRASVDASGGEANHMSSGPSISSGGHFVGFQSYASDLVASDKNREYDVFLRDLCGVPATWTNYGSGYPGTYGVPSLTSQQFPAFGATITVDLGNSFGQPTLGLLVLGLQRASIPTKWGGDLLALPTLIAPITFSYSGDSFTGTIPDDVALCGVTIDLQGIEADAGAAFGVSFSQGLELVIGN